MSYGDIKTLRERLGQGDDMRTEEEKNRDKISDYRKELIDDMLDIILKHKKEIRKIPQASYIDSARKYAAKRGLSAREVDLDGDNVPETVVYDRTGRYPVIVNGYSLGQSDYPVRREYWRTHDTKAKRILQPMNDWIDEEVYKTTKNKNNQWVNDKIELTETGRRLEQWDGYSMPTRPKKVMSPYSIFSKLISSYVKDFWLQQDLYDRLRIKQSTDGLSHTYELFKKIVSPITLYRVLYLRLVEQKFYFKKIDDNGRQPISYASFKKYMKEERGKKEFTKWFFDEILAGPNKERFNEKNVKMDVIIQNLVPGSPRKDLSDTTEPVNINHVLWHLIGTANWDNRQPFITNPKTGESFTLAQCLRNDEAAKIVSEILENKKDVSYRQIRSNIEVAKSVAQESVKRHMSKESIAKLISNEDAYKEYRRHKDNGEGINDIGSRQKNPPLRMRRPEEVPAEEEDDEEYMQHLQQMNNE